MNRSRKSDAVGGMAEDPPMPVRASPHISIRQYARLVHRWVESIGLERAVYGTHSMRRTKAAQIYRKTGNLRAVQLLLGHTKLDYLPRRTMSRRAATWFAMNANG